MMHRMLPALILAGVLLVPGESMAQEADTIRIGSDRVVIVISDGEVVLRHMDRADDAREREVRVERLRRPGAFRMMHRDGIDADTVEVDVERLVRRARVMAEGMKEWFDESEFRDRPLGAMLEGRGEIAELEMETRRLAREARRAEGEDRRRLEQELRTKLDELLTLRLETERERVQRLEEQAGEHRQRLERRLQSREEILERRFRELLGDDDLLDW